MDITEAMDIDSMSVEDIEDSIFQVSQMSDK